MTYDVCLGLGSNLGDRENNLREAVLHISRLGNTSLKNVSSIYETKPVGYEQQEDFLNMAIRIETEIPPFQLLEKLQEIELRLKRVRDIRWGPRTIDIDVLLFDGLSINASSLEVPHPRMFERAFVLVPLKDIYTGPINLQGDIMELIDRCNDKDGVFFFKCVDINEFLY